MSVFLRLCGLGRYVNMKIFVTAKPGAWEEGIEKLDDGHYVVSVTEPPVRGLANMAIIKLVAGYFGVVPADVNIVSGYTSRHKVIDVKGVIAGSHEKN